MVSIPLWPVREEFLGRSIVATACVAAAACVALLDQTLVAASDTGIRVVVTDVAGKAIKDAWVLVHADGTRRSRRPGDVMVRTDAEGVVELRVDAGVYDVCVMSDAVTPQCSKVLVDESILSEKTVRLVGDPLMGMLERRVVPPSVIPPPQSATPPPRRGEPCWSRDEAQNHDLAGKVLQLPKDLERQRVDRTDIALRVCVREDGSVERVLLLLSSGNARVDRAFRDQPLKWTFKPAQSGGQAVRSAADVVLTWQY